MYCYCVAVVLYHSVGQVQSTQTDHYNGNDILYAVRRMGGDDDDWAKRNTTKKKRSNLDENNKYNWSILNIWSLSTTSVLQTPQRRRVHNLRCTWVTHSRYPENRLRHRFIRLIEVAMRVVCVCLVVFVCLDKWKRNGHRNRTGKTRYRADCTTKGGRMSSMPRSSWCTVAIS